MSKQTCIFVSDCFYCCNITSLAICFCLLSVLSVVSSISTLDFSNAFCKCAKTNENSCRCEKQKGVRTHLFFNYTYWIVSNLLAISSWLFCMSTSSCSSSFICFACSSQPRSLYCCQYETCLCSRIISPSIRDICSFNSA